MEEKIINEEVVEPKPKKSKAGKIFLVFVLTVLLLIVGLGFWGYRQVVSMKEPMDLGVSYTAQDYEDLVSNIGIDVEPEKLCLDCPALNFSDPHEVEVVVTNEQASAAFDIVNEKLSYGSVRNSQVKFSDGMGELSTIFTFNGKDYPVYIAGTIEKASDTTISGEIFDIKAGPVTVPGTVKNMVEDGLVNLANERFATMGDTFRIDDGAITDEGIVFDGLVPTKAN
jgi:hypothetical protein